MKLWFLYVSITRKNHREHKVSRSEIFCHFLPSKKTHWIIPVKKKTQKEHPTVWDDDALKEAALGLKSPAAGLSGRALEPSARYALLVYIYKKRETCICLIIFFNELAIRNAGSTLYLVIFLFECIEWLINKKCSTLYLTLWFHKILYLS